MELTMKLLMQDFVPRYMLCATSLLLVFQATLHADDLRKLPVAAEPDARLQADGKGWRLDRAKVTDSTRPRVLLIGDSILDGYGKHVMSALAGKAHVDAWVNPYCQSEHLNKLIVQDTACHFLLLFVFRRMGGFSW